MIEDDDEPNLDAVPQRSPAWMRWLPPLVVVGAIAGFFSLAWVAYHSGGKPASDEDVMLIEADPTPMKESPKDPGGMKFPHQDKTIYDAIANNSTRAAKVERVMPPPEEPMEKPVPNSDSTTTWVRQSARNKQPEVLSEEPAPAPAAQETAKAETPPAAPAAITPVKPPLPGLLSPAPAPVPNVKMAQAEVKPEVKAETKVEVKNDVKPEAKPAEKEVKKEAAPAVKPVENKTAVQPAKPSEKAADVKTKEVAAKEVADFVEDEEGATLPVAPTMTSEKVAEKPAEAKQESPVKEEKATEKPAEKPAPAAKGTRRVQLGAFGSEEEANGHWKAISKKFASQLGAASPQVVRADLGEKGVYYRLQVAGFTSESATSLCGKLAAAKQPCMLVPGK